MNSTNIPLLDLLTAFAALAGAEQPKEKIVNGMKLVALTDGNAVYDEGVRQHNALVSPQMRDLLKQTGMTVMSMRDELTGASVLSLSVGEDDIVRHVVGKHNAAPSADQLDTLHQLLKEQGIELQYNPFTMY